MVVDIKIPSFKLSVYQKGGTDSPRLALVLPALLDTKDYSHIQSHVNFLARQDFLALSFDPPGTWGSKDEQNTYTVSNYLKAVNEIIAYYGNRPTLLVGHSLGGRIALLAANSTAVTAIVMIMFSATPLRINNSVDHFDNWEKQGSVTTYRDSPDNSDEKVCFDMPYSFFEDSQSHDVTKALRTVRKPELFIIGTEDSAIPLEEAYETYTVAAEPKELYKINCQHNYRKSPQHIHEMNRVMLQFYTNTHQKPPAFDTSAIS